VRTLSNIGLAVLLSVSVVVAPAMAAPANPASAPLGVVVQAEHAMLGADATSGGATIYDGDLLRTEGTGLLRASLGGPQMYLRQETITQVRKLPNGFSAELKSGSVVVASKQGQLFELLADGAVVRPSGADPVVAQITRVSAHELLFSSSRGALTVTMGDEVNTVEARASYRMEIETEAADPASTGGPFHTMRNHFLRVALIGIGVGTGVGIWRALISDCNP
jgi:hypothetical protein